jgi:DNA polymerase-3 subunit alpha
VICTLDDGTGVIEATIYNELFEPFKHLIKEDELLVVSGKVSEDRFNGGLRVAADKVMDLGAARIQYGVRMVVSINKAIDPNHLRDTLAAHRQEQGLPFVMKYRQADAACEVVLGDAWRINPSDSLQSTLVASFGKEAVVVEY